MIGFLHTTSPTGWAPYVSAFRNGLREAGYVEGQNVTIEYRWAEGQNDRLPALSGRSRSPSGGRDCRSWRFIVACGKGRDHDHTDRVFGGDPVAAGLVVSLSRPAGNVTGVTNLGVELLQKQVEMLHEVVPIATIVAGLVNPTFPGSEAEARDLQAAARALGQQVHVVYAGSERDLDTAFETMVRLGATALVIGVDPFFLSRRDQIAALAIRYAIPAIFYLREFVAAGALMSYGPSLPTPIARSATRRPHSQRREAGGLPVCSPPSSNW